MMQREIFVTPASPKQICEVLYSTPMLHQVHVLLDKGSTVALKTDIWAVQGILSTFPLPKTICFDLLGNYLLNYKNSVELCNSNINKVCNGKESCKYSEADFDKAEKLTITIDSIVYDILPKD